MLPALPALDHLFMHVLASLSFLCMVWLHLQIPALCPALLDLASQSQPPPELCWDIQWVPRAHCLLLLRYIPHRGSAKPRPSMLILGCFSLLLPLPPPPSPTQEIITPWLSYLLHIPGVPCLLYVPAASEQSLDYGSSLLPLCPVPPTPSHSSCCH